MPAFWLLAPRGCTHQLGAARRPRRLHGSPSAPASGAAAASARFPRWVSAVRSRRRALRWPPCALGSAPRGRGGGTGAGRAGGDAGREAPMGSAAPSPPTGVSHLRHSQVPRGRGRWGASGDYAKEKEESTAIGLGTRALRHPHSVSAWHSHTGNCAHTPTYPVQVQAHCCPGSHTELTGHCRSPQR